MVFWICQKWSFHWWRLKLLSQITDLKHFKHDWLNNFSLHQWKVHFWQTQKTMHQFCSVQLYPELTNQAETNQNIPQKLWRRVEKSGFWRLIILQLLSLYESGTRGRLRLWSREKKGKRSLEIGFMTTLWLNQGSQNRAISVGAEPSFQPFCRRQR